MKLSILVPVFNEEKTIVPILEKLVALKLSNAEKEIVIIDDGSKDQTASKIGEFFKKTAEPILRVLTDYGFI